MKSLFFLILSLVFLLVNLIAPNLFTYSLETAAPQITATDELPDEEEGNTIIIKFRNAARQQADIQGLNAKLDGEKSKADSLKASLAQIESVQFSSTSLIEEPKKAFGTVLTGAGAAVAVIGILLIFVIGPVMAAVAAAGALVNAVALAISTSAIFVRSTPA